jgi:ATP-dependent exoDNAse (exonuclease V) beta subunit
MLLARRRRMLPRYAEALQALGVPARLGGGEEAPTGAVHELALIVRLLADPADRVLTAAVLEGPAFACTPADLWHAYRAGVAPFALVTPLTSDVHVRAREDERVARVVHALTRLAGWRALAVESPPDVLASRIVDESGLLLHAAGDPSGDAPAAALLGAVQALRDAALDGRATLHDAVDALDDYMRGRDAWTTLRLGRGGAVQLLTIHAAKGLQAPVVLLVQPVAGSSRSPRAIVHRAAGEARVALQLRVDASRRGIVAQPIDWDRLVDEERVQGAAEDVRLRYVAATRAADELVVAIATHDGAPVDAQSWSHFAQVAPAWEPLVIPAIDASSPPAAPSIPLPIDAARLTAAATSSWSRRVIARATHAGVGDGEDGAFDVRASDALVPDVPPPRTGDASAAITPDDVLVTRLASEAIARPAAIDPRTWGRLVHRTLEAAWRGHEGAGLARAVRAVVREHGYATRDGAADAAVVDRLLALVSRVRESPVGASIARSSTRLVECPVRWRAGGDDAPVLVEGVLDLAIEVDGAWSVFDWKTDGGGDAEQGAAQRAQVAAYACALAARTGQPVTAHLVHLTAP